MGSSSSNEKQQEQPKLLPSSKKRPMGHSIFDNALFAQALAANGIGGDGADSRRPILPPLSWLMYALIFQLRGEVHRQYDLRAQGLKHIVGMCSWGPSRDKLAITDRDLNIVFTLDPENGKVIRKFEKRGLDFPRGIDALHDDGLTLAFCDRGNKRIVVMDAESGDIVRTFTDPILSMPSGLAVLNDGHTIVIGDNGCHKVIMFDGDTGAMLEVLPIDFHNCESVVLMKDETTLIVSEYHHDTVVLVDLPRRQLIKRIGPSLPNMPKNFSLPWGTVDVGHGRMWVADHFGNRIVEVKYIEGSGEYIREVYNAPHRVFSFATLGNGKVAHSLSQIATLVIFE